MLERDGHRCQDCGDKGSRRELDVHHLIRRADGGRDDASNCITLCDGCHAARHPNLQVSLSRRTIERWAIRVARFLDRGRELPDEVRALDGALRLFGVNRFRDGQLDAVLGALRGESLLVIRPTGGGKSLCFQLPAVLKGQPATFVLSPLKALMVDQVSGLQRRKLPATFINSDISRDEKEQRYALLEAGALSFCYLAPERFNAERVRPEEIARLTKQRPSFLVVDEVHLVDRWGDDFRMDYGRIAEIRHQLGDPPVLAFTATAGARTQERIKQSLGIPDARTLVSGVDRPNISLMRVTETGQAKRARMVADLIGDLPNGRAMVFVPTTNVGRRVQEALRAAGCDLPLYHAKLPASEREGILGRFTGTLDPPLKAVICTSAFSMGLDVPDVRAVINWQHTAAVEDYLQEFGRAGRDGHPALAVLFREGGKETGLLHWMAKKTAEQVVVDRKRSFEQAQGTLRGKRERIDEMARIASQSERCFRAELNEALQGPAQQQRRSWSVRVLDWVFARTTPVRRAGACCDVCNAEVVQQIRAGRYALDVPSTKLVPGRKAERRGTRSSGRRVSTTAAVVAVVFGGGFAASAVTGGEDAGAVARESFERYTGAFAEAGEFSAPEAKRDGETYAVCGDHARDGSADPGRYALCLVIDPSRSPSDRVLGGYKLSDARGKHECYGVAAEQCN